MVEQAEQVVRERSEVGEIGWVGRAEVAADPGEGGGDGQGNAAEDVEAAAERAHAALDEVRDGEGGAGEMEVESGEHDPPADGVGQGVAAEEAPPVGDQREKQGGEEDRELGAEELEVEEGAAGDGGRKQEGGFGLGETQTGFGGGQNPREEDDAEEQEGADGGDQRQGFREDRGQRQGVGGVGGGRALGAAAPGGLADAAEKDEIEIGGADEGADEVFGLTQPSQPRNDLVLERREPEIEEGAEHRRAGGREGGRDGAAETRRFSARSRRWRGGKFPRG